METVSEIKISYLPGAAAEQHPIVSSPKEAANIFYQHFDADTINLQEQVLVMYLNRRNRVRGIYNGFRGGISSSQSDLRIILGIALKGGCSGIILAHNHPSGNMEPSEKDILITNTTKKACELMEVSFIDHLIIVPGFEYFSFAENGKL